MSSDWCAQISDNTRINQLAIPGTHDAAAWTHDWDEVSTPGTWAQRQSITEQLNLGVRVLDLRVGWSLGWGWSIGMYHGPIYVGSTLDQVLTEVNDWLAEHAREFVILIFQQQGAVSKADLSGDVRTLVRDRFGANLYNFNPNQQLWPTVGEMRGKVLAMGRLQNDVAGFCNVRSWLTTGDNTDGVVINAGTLLRIYLQDRYKNLSGENGFQSMAQDNNLKFAKVRAAARAIPNVASPQLLKINHMSYSNLRYQPWESGEGMNTLLRDSTLAITGVLMIDDADEDTVNHILTHNAQFRTPTLTRARSI
jgi:hypothetical protein